ncbi:MAG: hypothetical protein D6798_15105 [Deltaproteobacteria bacterium]|nr:MAG: hypothetical protein D6798_15105 [Deltaproteobacteria bacterium]
MGPNDPFEPGLPSPDEMLLDPPEDEWRGPASRGQPPRVSRALSTGQLGFAIGVGFGLLTLLTGLRDSLVVLAFGLAGAGILVGAESIRRILPELRSAWAAVMEERANRPPRAGR